jgi:hypothetical protein
MGAGFRVIFTHNAGIPRLANLAGSSIRWYFPRNDMAWLVL